MRIHSLWSLALACTALLLWNGCISSRVIEKSRVPEIVIDDSGAITFNNRRLEPGKIANTLRSAGIERTQEVNILIPDKPDRAIMRTVSAELVRSGYTRTVFVKNRKASAVVPKPQ